MINKTYLAALFFCLGSLHLNAKDVDLELRGAYFMFNSETLRKIYSDAAPSIALESTFQIKDPICMFLNGEYIWKQGKTTTIQSGTSIKIGTISLGPKLVYKTKGVFNPYLGVGIMGACVHTHDSDPYFQKVINKGACGVIGKLGFTIKDRRFSIYDFFVDYSYLPVHINFHGGINRSRIDFGGLRAGIGIGYQL